MVLRRHDKQTRVSLLTVSPVGLSIVLGVSLCFIGLALMWYHMYVVVVGHGAPWEHVKIWQ